MRILLLAHRLPFPPHTGDKVRAYHVARHLAARHELTLLCPADEPGPALAAARLREEVPDVRWVRVSPRLGRVRALLALAAGGSATRAYFHSRALHREVASCLARGPVDLVYVSSSSMAQYAPDGGPAVVADFVDVDSDKWRQYGQRTRGLRRWVYRREARRLRAEERAAAWRARHCLVATAAEARLLREIAPWARTTVIRNGVDLERFAPASGPPAGATVVFTGAMDYFPNADAAAWFARSIFPRVRREVPEARFVVVGKAPVLAVRRLGVLPGVEVTGAVPDVRPYLRAAAVAVAPLRVARGVQNKVLEAMASGLPVVATPAAHAGLEARPGVELLVEETADGFADAVAGLLRRPDRCAALGRAARAFVEARHSWADAMHELDGILAEVGGGARRGAALAGAGT